MKDDRTYLAHIRECLECVARFTAAGRAEFMEDRKTRSAVLRELQTLAESCQRLSPSLNAGHPEVFWQGIAGFRHVLVHDYLGISAARVWEIIENDIPVLRRAVDAMLSDTGGAGS